MNPFIWSAIGQAGTAYTDAMQRLGEQKQKKQQQEFENQQATEEMQMRVESAREVTRVRADARKQDIVERYHPTFSRIAELITDAERASESGDSTRAGQLLEEARGLRDSLPEEVTLGIPAVPTKAREATEQQKAAWLIQIIKGTGGRPSEELYRKVAPAGLLGSAEPAPSVPYTPLPPQVLAPTPSLQLRQQVPGGTAFGAPTAPPTLPPIEATAMPTTPLVEPMRLTAEPASVLGERERAKNRPSRAWELIRELGKLGVTLSEYQADPQAGADFLSAMAVSAGQSDLTPDVFLPLLKNMKPMKAKEAGSLKLAAERVAEVVRHNKAVEVLSRDINDWRKYISIQQLRQAAQRIGISAASLDLAKLKQNTLSAYQIARLGARGPKEQREAMLLLPKMKGLAAAYIKAAAEQKDEKAKAALTDAAQAYQDIVSGLEKEATAGGGAAPPMGAGVSGSTTTWAGPPGAPPTTFTQPGRSSATASGWVSEMRRKGTPAQKASIQKAKNANRPQDRKTDQQLYDHFVKGMPW